MFLPVRFATLRLQEENYLGRGGYGNRLASAKVCDDLQATRFNRE